MFKKSIIYLNLTNGIEALSVFNVREFRVIRIQSTWCEQKLWSKIIEDIDYDFLMNLALGNPCIIYDFGAKKLTSRAVYQGVEFVRFFLSKRWFPGSDAYTPNVRGHNCTKYFEQEYKKVSDRAKNKVDYFRDFLFCDDIDLIAMSGITEHDGDRKWYANLVQKFGSQNYGFERRLAGAIPE